MGKEAKVRDPVVAWARQNGVKHQRMAFRPGVKRAFPDDLFLIPGGRPLMIEFKAPGEHPTELQAHRIKELLELGYDVLATSDANEARAAITRAMDTATLYEKGGKPPKSQSRRRPAAAPGRP